MMHMSQILNHALYLFVLCAKHAGITQDVAVKLVEQTYETLD